MPRAAARTHDDEFPSNIIYRKIFSMFNFRNCENFASKFCYVRRTRAFYIEKNRFVFLLRFILKNIARTNCTHCVECFVY